MPENTLYYGDSLDILRDYLRRVTHAQTQVKTPRGRGLPARRQAQEHPPGGPGRRYLAIVKRSSVPCQLVRTAECKRQKAGSSARNAAAG